MLPGIAVETFGRFKGIIDPAFDSPALRSQLDRLDSLIKSEEAVLVAGGRNRNVHITLDAETGPLEVMVKAFGRQSSFKDRIDRLRGSRARRSWLAAFHLTANEVGTPTPIGYLERWDGNRLIESYFLAMHMDGALSLGDALLQLFHEDPECERFVHLFEGVAELCRRMHDAGFAHGDLGNQNILMQSRGGRWQDFRVIDLNRGTRDTRALSVRRRAQDLSRLDLPSAFLELFLSMYWEETPPAALVRWHRWYRALFQLHARSRRLRHPIREARLERERKRNPAVREMPASRDLWVWDRRTAQAFGVLSRKERIREYPSSRARKMLKDTLMRAPAIWHAYRRLRPLAFGQSVAMQARIGIAIEPDAPTWDKTRALLSRLPAIPVSIRFYHHETPARHDFLVGVVRELASERRPILIALVQDRTAVTNPASWNEFVARIVDAAGEYVQKVEVGHAVNRVKWGIWDFGELRRLYAPIEELSGRWPSIEFIGPATIDFEYAFTLSALEERPPSLAPGSLSHHLYVDRRGAPENPQTGFGSIEKFALARALSSSSGKCNGRVIVSEVNWPLDGTGSFSPIAQPWIAKDRQSEPVGVDEETYAAYMIRYLLLGIASGYVDQIYWWRLVARGYGLVDDTDPAHWRERIGLHAFENLLRVLGGATFREAALPPQTADRHGSYLLTFEAESETIMVAWTHGDARAFPNEIDCSHVEDMTGNRLETVPASLSGSPVYLRGVA